MFFEKMQIFVIIEQYMDIDGLDRNIHALQSLYPQPFVGVAQPLPREALNGLPIWIKGAARVFALVRLEAPHEPFLYLVKPEPEIAFEYLMRVYRQLIEKLSAPVLVSADNISPKHRPLLVKFNIAFIYKNESVYAPELGLKFDRISRFEKGRTIHVENKKEAITPFALKLIAGLLTNQIPPEFTLNGLRDKILQEGVEVSAAKLSLTLKKLVKNGLLLAGGAGPTRKFAKAEVEITWIKILALTLAPFFRERQTNYVPKNRDSFCIAGETALAQYSNLAAGTTETIAMGVKEFRESYEKKKTEIPLGEMSPPRIIQIWKEPPHLFAIQGVMNPIEVFFAMRSHHDERVQMALDEMLKPYGLIRKEN